MKPATYRAVWGTVGILIGVLLLLVLFVIAGVLYFRHAAFRAEVKAYERAMLRYAQDQQQFEKGLINVPPVLPPVPPEGYVDPNPLR